MNDFEKEWEQALLDAVTLGMGVVIIRSDLSMERVGPDKYQRLTESLDWITSHQELPHE